MTKQQKVISDWCAVERICIEFISSTTASTWLRVVGSRKIGEQTYHLTSVGWMMITQAGQDNKKAKVIE